MVNYIKATTLHLQKQGHVETINRCTQEKKASTNPLEETQRDWEDPYCNKLTADAMRALAADLL